MLAALLLAASTLTLADAFVPADPRPLRAECADAAYDVLAAGVSADDDRPLNVSVAGAAWRPFPGVTGCPTVAAADDGTAAIVASNEDAAQMLVRRPGGDFGAPIALGPTSREVAVAAARGGWVIATWVERPDDGTTNTLTALTVRPDGTVTRTRLDSVGEGFLGQPRVAIAPTGDATVMWSRSDDRNPVMLRIARGTPLSAADLAPVIAGTGTSEAYDVAISPAGTTLVTWSTGRGISAAIDGAPAQVVDASTGTSQISAAVNDAGAAALAYGGSGGLVVAVDRPAGGAWGIPTLIARVDEDLRDRGLVPTYEAVVTGGGRAAIAWVTERERRTTVLAASAQTGGQWSAPDAVSAVTRDGWAPSLSLDSTGAPRLVWMELGRGVLGAVWRQAAQIDETPPEVRARLPKRTAPTRSGRFVAEVRVRCSEACDARLTLPDDELSAKVRALAAGRTVTLRLRATHDLGRRVLARPRARRQRLELVVTDRGGNVVRRNASLRVRVVERSLRSFKVKAGHYFAMESKAGEQRVRRLVNDLIDDIAAGRIDSQRGLRRAFDRDVAAIRRAGHDDIDTAYTREEIHAALQVPLERRGLSARFIFDVD